MEFLQFYTLEIEDRERIVVNDDLVFKGPEVPDKIDENRELDRLEVKTLKFSKILIKFLGSGQFENRVQRQRH